MRSLMVSVAIMSMIWPGAVSAQIPGVKPVRSAQIIVTGERATNGGKPQTSSAAPGSGAAPSPLPAAFRVHDLSRRWVEFEMANDFANVSDRVEPTGGGAPQVGGMDSSRILPLPPIAAPAWMRGRATPIFAQPYTPGCTALPYSPTSFLEPDAELRRANHYRRMSEIACEYGIPVGLFDAMIIRESRYKTGALSLKKAFGLTQLMPGTAAHLGVDRYSVEGNLRGGAKYLRRQLDTFGQYHLALAAYNAGPGRVRGGQVPQIAETQAYVDNVLSDWARLTGLPRHAIVLSKRFDVPPDSESMRAPLRRPLRIASVSLF